MAISRHVRGNLYEMVRPPAPKKRRPPSIESLFRAAYRAREDGREKTAIKLYRVCLKRPGAKKEFALNNLGEIFLRKADSWNHSVSLLGLARRYFCLALNYNPRYALAAYNLGLCFHIRFEWKKADQYQRESIKYYRLSRRLNPEYEDARYNLGMLLAESPKKNDRRWALWHLRQVHNPDCAVEEAIKDLTQICSS